MRRKTYDKEADSLLDLIRDYYGNCYGELLSE